ncbi:MAG: Hsp20/alpha crystallin family protein [Kiritimatiellae bacterium]|jgi:HSP20 family protein|nr:Hsp20/alpha crystallin family protein [Kiritimatiellia bacterium]
MNTLMNINPWSILNDLLDANSRAFRNMRARAAGRFPPVNVYLDDDAIIVDVELPGKTAKDVELSLEPQAVSIADHPAETTDAETGKAAEAQPAWSRRLELPFRVDADKVNAKFANGILRIELPRAEKSGVRRIAIEG